MGIFIDGFVVKNFLVEPSSPGRMGGVPLTVVSMVFIAFCRDSCGLYLPYSLDPRPFELAFVKSRPMRSRSCIENRCGAFLGVFQGSLVGGFKYFLFSPLLGEDFQFE